MQKREVDLIEKLAEDVLNSVFEGLRLSAEATVKLKEGVALLCKGSIFINQQGFPFMLDPEETTAIYNALDEARNKKADNKTAAPREERPTPLRDKGGVTFLCSDGTPLFYDKGKNSFHTFGPFGNIDEYGSISGEDVAYMYGIMHPDKINGTWKGYCGEGPNDETPKQETK